MSRRQSGLEAVAPEPVDDDETRPLLDSEHPDHGTITEQQAAQEARDAELAENADDAAGPTTGQVILTMAPLYCTAFFAAADSTIVATLASPISGSFKSFTLITWVAAGYLIANAAIQPLSGRISDIYGRRPGVAFACIFFSAGTLMCGLAPTPGVLIAGRLIAGAGGGCLNTLSTFIGTDILPLRRRGLWQGIGNLVYGSGMAIGGFAGGFINDRLGWRWVFYIQVPFILVAGSWAWFTVNIPVKETDKSKIKRVDFAGALTLVTSLVLLLIGLNTGGNIYPWTHPIVIVSLILSVASLVLFAIIEAKYAAEPIIPVRLLLQRSVICCLLCNWFVTMAVFATYYYGPIYFSALQHLSATATGARFIPSSVGTALGSLAAGIIMRITGRYYVLNMFIALLAVFSAALIAIFFRPGLPLWAPFPIVAAWGLAGGAVITTTLMALLASVPHKDQAVITSAQYAFRSTGSTIGITLAGAVFQNILVRGLDAKFGDSPDAARIIARLRDDPGEIANLGPRWKKGVEECYADALRGVWGLVLGLTILGSICLLLVKEHKLHATMSRK